MPNEFLLQYETCIGKRVLQNLSAVNIFFTHEHHHVWYQIRFMSLCFCYTLHYITSVY